MYLPSLNGISDLSRYSHNTLNKSHRARLISNDIIDILLTTNSANLGLMYVGACGRDDPLSVSVQNSINTNFVHKKLADLPALPTVSFEIPKPVLMTPEQIETQLRLTESWGRVVRGFADPAIPSRQQRPSTFVAPPSEIDWTSFKSWLAKKYSRGHSHDIYNTALKYHECACLRKEIR